MTSPVRRIRGRAPELIRRLAVPIVIGWALLAGVLNAMVPQLERVVAEHSPPFLQADTRSATALVNMARAFGEGDTNNTVYVALVAEKPLDSPARSYYTRLVGALREEPLVQSVRDLWSDPIAGAAAESADHRMAYLQLWLQGNMGEARSFESLDRVKQLAAQSQPPQELQVYVTGPPAVIIDEFRTADRDALIISLIACVVILAMLLLVYRSLATALVPLISVGLALLVARPVISLLGVHGVVAASMFAAAMSAALILGAGADYAIFFIGRYHEALRAGRNRTEAYSEAYLGVNHIVVASALTIAGACSCLTFAQISVLQTAGIPCAVGILIGLASGLTLTPALVALGGRSGRLDPVAGTERHRRWRRIGTGIVRWPQPTFIAAAAALTVLTLALPTMRVSFDEIGVQPDDTPSVRGLAELDRHFPHNQATPDFITITTDHDMRNSSDAMAIEEVSRELTKLPDVQGVQSITRPTGHLLAESMLVNQASALGGQLEQDTRLAEQRLTDLRRADDGLGSILQAVENMQGRFGDADSALTATDDGIRRAGEGVQSIWRSAEQLSAAVEPLRSMVSTNPHCATDPLCGAVQRALDGYDRSPLPGALDGLRASAGATGAVADDTGRATESIRAAVRNLSAMKQELVDLRGAIGRAAGTFDALLPQLNTANDYLREVGDNYGASESGAFYLPQRVFDDPRFATAVNALYAPDGKTTRLLVFGDTSAFGRSGIERAREIQRVAEHTVRGGRLAGAVIQVGGIGATFSDIDQIIARDFKLLVIVTMLLVFSVVLTLLRSLVAALVVVTTVAVSFGAALGASTLLWQHLLGLPLHWVVPPLAFIALVAVGSDYNLLFTARFREEAPGGLRTGIIRAFAGTGSVVTVAGVVFAATMFAMLGSSLTNVMQLGSTVGIGLLVDTFIVRAVIVPALATRFGMWFWWPLSRQQVFGVQAGRQ
ncbi:RND family transporter [Mycobacterium sp. CSUR Q5927]|nr:RND family transporter [Mycobacterium sp. CSUR Q5927]